MKLYITNLYYTCEVCEKSFETVFAILLQSLPGPVLLRYEGDVKHLHFDSPKHVQHLIVCTETIICCEWDFYDLIKCRPKLHFAMDTSALQIMFNLLLL